MKKFMTIAALCMMVSAAVAGNGSKVAKATSNNTKSGVVYFYTNNHAHGVWYHTDSKCALKCKEYVFDGTKAVKGGISCTKEKNAKERGMMECPTCAAHNHATCKNDVASVK
jgi:hypothetical protein